MPRLAKKRGFVLTHILVNVHNVKDTKHFLFEDVDFIDTKYVKSKQTSYRDTKHVLSSLAWGMEGSETLKVNLDTHSQKEVAMFNYLEDEKRAAHRADVDELIMDVDVYLAEDNFTSFQRAHRLEYITTSDFVRFKDKAMLRFNNAKHVLSDKAHHMGQAVGHRANQVAHGVKQGARDWADGVGMMKEDAKKGVGMVRDDAKKKVRGMRRFLAKWMDPGETPHHRRKSRSRQ